MSRQEGTALVTTLDKVAPSAPTACSGWSAHDIVAHLAAGSKEIADLIGEKLTGQPPRPTRAFEEREPPFRALPNDELRAAWATQARRKTEAVEALAALGEDATVDFTGTAMTAARLSTHSRSEAAVHRWDIAGDDAVSDELLAQPELTAHAVSVLNAMPILLESSRARMTQAERLPLRIVLRAPEHPDVALGADTDGHARFELVEGGTADGDAIVESDPAQRLLIIWGRRSWTRSVRDRL
jgi:uncharacterized protein (TIGR03083 family)